MTQEEFDSRAPRYCFFILIADNEKQIDKEATYNTNRLETITSELEKMIVQLKNEQ